MTLPFWGHGVQKFLNMPAVWGEDWKLKIFISSKRKF